MMEFFNDFLTNYFIPHVTNPQTIYYFAVAIVCLFVGIKLGQKYERKKELQKH